jgi:hypothetical protein
MKWKSRRTFDSVLPWAIDEHPTHVGDVAKRGDYEEDIDKEIRKGGL